MLRLRKNKKVFVAMSGGVDSSVAAALLQAQGYEVVGVTMCFNTSFADGKRPSCCGVDAIQDAKAVAQTLHIPHYVLNFSQDLQKKVIDDFFQEYIQGRTPNPCVRCNQYLKFGTLLNKVKALGADYLATGHYARIERRRFHQGFALKKSIQGTKDQSYFLYQIQQKDLPSILFPLGSLTKERVRALARKYGLRNAQKKESQDICFIPDSGYQKFLKDHLGPQAFAPGPIKDAQGKVLGQHQGIAFYTIGQRDGLGVALGKPAYVYNMEAATNTLYLGPKESLYSQGLVARHLNFVSQEYPKKTIEVEVKIRYNHPQVRAHLTCGQGVAEVYFDKPQMSVTPGQSAVFYKKDILLGGGIIEKAITIDQKGKQHHGNPP